ncbi:MAG: c-type cytochrome [Pseudomonadales bacterium]
MRLELSIWWRLSVLLSLLLAGAPPALADADGAELYQVCAVCHGDRAQGSEAFEAPRLAGQHGWYLETQLRSFRAGVRGKHPDDETGQIMQPMAVALTDDDIDVLVEHIGTFEAAPADDEEDYE